MEERSIFIEFIGDSAMTRVLDYLLTERELDFSISDIARNAKIGRATLYRIWNNLIRNDIIIFTRRIGKAQLFKLNTKDSKIKKLIGLYDGLIIEDLKKKSVKKIKVKI